MDSIKSTVTVSRKSNIKNFSTRISIKFQNAIDSTLNELNESYGNLSLRPIEVTETSQETFVECVINNVSPELKNCLNTKNPNYKKLFSAFKNMFLKHIGKDSVKDFDVVIGEFKGFNTLTITAVLKLEKLFQNSTNTFLSFKEEIKTSSINIPLRYIVKSKLYYYVKDKVFKFPLKDILVLYKSSDGKDIWTKTLIAQKFTDEEINILLNFLLSDCFAVEFTSSVLKRVASDYYHRYLKTEFLSELTDHFMVTKNDFKFFMIIEVDNKPYIFFSNNAQIFNNIIK